METEVNPFTNGASAPMKINEVGGMAAVFREKADIEAAIVSAKRFPREESKAYSKIMKSCERPLFAESTTYVFPRGGKDITGPSVDLARELARCWGNLRYGVRIVSSDPEADGMVHIKGFALDLETNSYVELEDKFKKVVQRKVSKTETRWVPADERDLRELINRRGAICERNAILKLLPPDLVDAALQKSRETNAKAVEGKVDGSREDTIRKLVHAFDRLGVTLEMIEARLGHPIAAVDLEEIVTLKGIYKSIVDGNSKRAEHFEFAEPVYRDTKAAELDAMLRDKPETKTKTVESKDDPFDLDSLETDEK